MRHTDTVLVRERFLVTQSPMRPASPVARITRPSKTRDRARALRSRQTGSALLFTLILAALAATGAALVMFAPPSVDLAADRRTADALTAGRNALIAYAVTQGGQTGLARPGDFPCPDMDNDGRAEAVCAAGALGRLPWLTLGIPELKDGAGENLWYAVALPFRNKASNASAINSDTLGNLSVFVAGSATPVTTQAVAVVLAPGAGRGGQKRGTLGGATCAATGTSLAANLCASNYLEAYQGVDNTAANGPFITVAGKPPDTFNDRLIYIRTTDFIPAVEQRVGAELRDLIVKYRTASTCNCYPWAADWAAFTGQAVAGRNWGRFPTVALPLSWGAGGAPALPQWVGANNWHNVIYYSAGRGQLEGAGTLCTTCTASITLSVTEPTGVDAVSAVLLTPGTPRIAVTRPNATLANYFEDPQNNHASLVCPASGSVPAGCDAYIRPTATSIDRDRLQTMTTSALTCSDSAESLAAIARSTTCGGPGNTVIASCKAAVAQLAACSCKAAASTMTKPPCYNVSNKPNAPSQCKSALTQLDQCS